MNLVKKITIGLLASAGLAVAEKPNIIMIFSDDMHYGALGATGSHNTKAKTPNIDSIFHEGVFFPQGYSSHATCAPSRAGLMTGRYQARFDYETLPGSTESRIKDDFGVDVNEVMMPAVLKQAGYRTAAFGKWHLGTNDHFQPNQRGFDHWFGYRGSCGYYQFRSEVQAARVGKKYTPKEGEKPMLDIVRNGESVQMHGYLTEHFTADAANWIKQEAKTDEPFFVYFAPYNVHAPDLAPPKYTPEGGSPNDGVIQALDMSVGGILDAVREAGIEDNTVIVFADDNGGKKEYGNDPYRAGKATFYEGGVRVPFAMKWPKQIKPGTKYDGLVSTLDMLPTFAAIAGADMPEGKPTDGYDLMPFIRGEKTAAEGRKVLFWRNGGAIAVRSGDWKLVMPVDRRKVAALLKSKGIVHEKGRMVTQAERDRALFQPPELYNLKDDVGETTDLAAKNPEMVQQLLKLIDEWESTIPRWRDE